ncbi:MAG: hypothetical protein Q4B96_04195 [Bacillota bacterium]|nr:hypothetical protein [Bacillota bacterium]
MRKTIPAKNIIALLLFAGTLLAFVVCASNIVMPKRYELGANWGAFTAEEPNSMDVVLFGSSMAYCNVIPAVIWEDSGLTTYIMAGPEQTPAVTYYYVKEMFRTQHPSAVLVESSCIHYTQATGRDAIKVNLGYMPYDAVRLEATFLAAPPEQRLGLIFPLYNYHDRWSELTQDDYRLGLRGYAKDPLAGYHFLSESEPQDAPRQRRIEQEPEDYAANLSWLLKIAALCQQEGSRCIFYISGSYAYFEENYLAELAGSLTADTGAEFINCMADLEQMELDPARDFYDILHFNYAGAIKFSHYLSDKLTEMGVTPQRPFNDPQQWQSNIEHFHNLVLEAEG